LLLGSRFVFTFGADFTFEVSGFYGVTAVKPGTPNARTPNRT